MSRHLGFLTAIIVFATFTSKAADLVDSEFGFRITIPDEFQDFPAGKNRPEVLYSFLRPSESGEKNVNIIIERLNGTISREPLPAETDEAFRNQMPPGGQVGIYKTKWRGYPVEGIEARMPIGGIEIIVRGAQIPLQKEAIQVMVGGPTVLDSEITRVLEQILGTLRGETNWELGPGRTLTTEERISSGVKALIHTAWIIAVAIGIATMITFAYRNRKKKDDTPDFTET